ncbi:MAG: DUF3991 and toprim domain-containing protein [Candidatus Hydrogenedentes bacterium]|nr:DUF3991 and toprim domain-containing protein [Candidatus Hydrogenedentota bacterium]
MTNRNDELENFKTEINLTEYAAHKGFRLDRKTSSRNSALMTDGAGDKVVIARGFDRHWVYFSVHDESDSGSIIDFVQNRKGVNLGAVRKELRPWLGGGLSSIPPQSFMPELEPLSRDIASVRSRYARMVSLDAYHSYLNQARKIPAEVLSESRFLDRIRADERGTIIFPHWNRDGLCGYEIKGPHFTGFARGGQKGLWYSHSPSNNQILVIAETAIDALSYAALKPMENARYASTGGQLNPDQKVLLARAMAKMPENSEIILAFDNDKGGHDLTERLKAILSPIEAPGLRLSVDMPSGKGQDWNDTLRASEGKIGPFGSLDNS